MTAPPLTILMSLETAEEMVEAGHIPPMQDVSPATLRARNHLINYAKKRVDHSVMEPLIKDSTTLEVAEEKLSELRAHFLKLHIAIGPLYVKHGAVHVDIGEVPR